MKKAVKKARSVEYSTALNAGCCCGMPYKRGSIFIDQPGVETFVMPAKEFKKRFDKDGSSRATTKPKKIKGFFASAKVKIRTTYGVVQKLPAGSFLVVRKGRVVFGIKPKTFERLYRIQS